MPNQEQTRREKPTKKLIDSLLADLERTQTRAKLAEYQVKMMERERDEARRWCRNERLRREHAEQERDEATKVLGELTEESLALVAAKQQAEQERDEERHAKNSAMTLANNGFAEKDARLAKVDTALVEALKKDEAKQREALALCEKHGFVFDNIGAEPGNWQHLAFTLYTMLCEVQSESSAALADWNNKEETLVEVDKDEAT